MNNSIKKAVCSLLVVLSMFIPGLLVSGVVNYIWVYDSYLYTMFVGLNFLVGVVFWVFYTSTRENNE